MTCVFVCVPPVYAARAGLHPLSRHSIASAHISYLPCVPFSSQGLNPCARSCKALAISATPRRYSTGQPLLVGLTVPVQSINRRGDVAATIAIFARAHKGYDEQHGRMIITSIGQTYVVRSDYVFCAIQRGQGGPDTFWHGQEIL